MSSISERKDHHLDLCLDATVETGGLCSGLQGLTLEYDALPEVDLDEVDLSCEVLGKRLAAPILIGAMTGGSEQAGLLNARLARAAASLGLGMALGSQRAMLVDPGLTRTYAVRDVAPNLPLLLGNIGAVQLNLGVSAGDLERAMAAVQADGLFFHLNPLQEAIQPEGDTCFRGLFERLADLIPRLTMPCLVKEVGAGISRRTAEKLARLPLAGIEASGVGGTSWARVESRRAPSESVQAEVGERLRAFGIPTAASIVNCRRAMGSRLVIASGGIRHGLDAALALCLGADAVAMARPLLVAAQDSEEAVVRRLSGVIHELRVVTFCCGARTVAELRQRRLLSVEPPGFASNARVPWFDKNADLVMT